MKQSLRIVFAGTPAFGLPALKALYEAGHDICAVYTQPDRPAGRGRKLQMSPVKEWAVSQQIPVHQPLNFKNEEAVDTLAALQPDVMVVIAYGLILPQTVLDIPRLGCVNVHASLLPRWRGASPIQHAICHGDAQSGVTIMQMDAGMDTGDMLKRASCPITSEDTAGTLHDRLADMAVSPLLTSLEALALGKAQPQKQDEEQATYAPKIKKEDALIHWEQKARQIDFLVRGYNPWPMAYTILPTSTSMRILAGTAYPEAAHNEIPGTILSIDKNGIEVSCGEGVYRIEQLQFSGRKIMSVTQWLNGYKGELSVGASLISSNE